MEYPHTLPSRLRPRFDAELLRITLEFPRNGQVKTRIENALFRFAEIVCTEVRENRWRADLALQCLYDLLHRLCVWDQANEFPLTSPSFLRFSEPIKGHIINSRRWLEVLEDLAASSQARKDAAQTDRTTDQHGFNSKTEKDSTTTCSTPQPLPVAKHVKKRDLNMFLDSAGLTERQHQCASLRWECELSVSAIARELNIRRITVDEHLKYARRKMEASGQYEKMRRNLSEVKSGEE